MIRLLAASLLALSALPAAARPADCYVEIDALVVIDGDCDFQSFGGDGSFQVATPDGGYFVYVSVYAPGRAEGHWNETRWSGHAHSPIGTLTRRDACWSNGYATVCAW